MPLMEETQLTPQPDSTVQGCVACGNSQTLEEHPTRLCADCRQKFINYPFPKWIWLFGGGVLVIVIISLFTLPRNLAIGIALEKGKKAAHDHNYVTAEREFKKVVAKVPTYTEGNAQLMIAS